VHLQQMLGVIHHKGDLVTGITEVFFDGIDQHIVADGLGRADPQLQALLICNSQLQFLKLVLLRDGISLQQQAFFCFMQGVAIISKELCLQRLLQSLDLLGNRWLGKVKSFCRHSVIHRLAECQKCMQFRIHVHYLNNNLELIYSV